uniref:Uncharacterized protein n=1 Tax=Vitis vinifera TaxID=29760 RepID=F6GZ09_VITVI
MKVTWKPGFSQLTGIKTRISPKTHK